MNEPVSEVAAVPVILLTEHLLLRPLNREDIPPLLPPIGAREIAATTLRIPHPYTREDAEKFLDHVDGVWQKPRAHALAFATSSECDESYFGCLRKARSDPGCTHRFLSAITENQIGFA